MSFNLTSLSIGRRKNVLSRVMAILFSRASQPIAQSNTGVLHSIFFLSSGSRRASVSAQCLPDCACGVANFSFHHGHTPFFISPWSVPTANFAHNGSPTWH